MASPTGSSCTRLHYLDALRGGAAVVVVLYHLQSFPQLVPGRPNPQAFAFGHPAVGIFFTLSGFLIYLIHRDDLGSPSRIPRFLWLRFLRIAPLYWTITLAVAAAMLVVHSGESVSSVTLRRLVESLLLWPLTSGFILPPAWTLVHELKFYLLFALAIGAGRVPGLLTATALSIATAVFCWYIFGTDSVWPRQTITGLVLHSANWYFVTGILAAHYVGRVRAYTMTLTAGVLLWCVVLVLDLVTQNLAAYGALGYLICPVASAACIHGLAGRDLDRDAPRLRAPMAALADLSYPLYLVHLPVLALFNRLLPVFGWREAQWWAPLLAVTACLIASLVLHRLIERPLLALRGPEPVRGATERQEPETRAA